MSLTAYDWIEVLARVSEIPDPFPASDELNSLLFTMRPTTLYYYSVLNPVFLMAGPSVARLNQAPHWLARDGAVPLAHFFRKHPTPHAIKSTLYIHEQCAGVVPKAWSKSVKLYRLVPSPNPPHPKFVKSTLLCGLVVSHYAALSQKPEHLAQVQKMIRAASKKSLELSFFLQQQVLGAECEAENADLSRQILKICRTLPIPTHVLHRDDFYKVTHSLYGHQIAEVNERLLIADSFLIHKFLRRGAGLFTPPLKSAHVYIPISPFYGYEISEFSPAKHRDASYLKKVEKLLAMPTKQPYPWSKNWENA